jgi:hypothetical protein
VRRETYSHDIEARHVKLAVARRGEPLATSRRSGGGHGCVQAICRIETKVDVAGQELE